METKKFKDPTTFDTYEWQDLTNETEPNFPGQTRGINVLTAELNNIPDRVKVEPPPNPAASTEPGASPGEQPKIQPPGAEPAAPAAPGVVSPKRGLSAKFMIQGWDTVFAGACALMTKRPEVYELAKASEKDRKNLSEMLGEIFEVYQVDINPLVPFFTGFSAIYANKGLEIYKSAKENETSASIDERIAQAEKEAKLADLNARIRATNAEQAKGSKSAPAAPVSSEKAKSGAGRPAGSKSRPGAAKPGPRPKAK